MCIKLLTEHHLEFLSLKGGITGWYEHTLIKMPHCWKSHVTAHLTFDLLNKLLFYPVLDTLPMPVLSEKFHPPHKIYQKQMDNVNYYHMTSRLGVI